MEDAPAISDEADPLYQPLGDIEQWAAEPVDAEAWNREVDRLHRLRAADPDAADLLERGARLAAAHRSGALDGLYPEDPGLIGALLAGQASLAEVGHDERPHVRANYEALQLARDVIVSEALVRRVHEVACGPQLHHRVWVGEELRDHVLAGGDYKHHPNHVRTASGEWRPTAPVALVRPEMARVLETAASPAFAAIHPVTQAAYLHDALLHIQPFADGNGRVARALAGGVLLRAESVPMGVRLGEVSESPALDRWRRDADAGRTLQARLGPAVDAALGRYDGGWGVDLSAATVRTAEPVTITVGEVVEILTVDAHPLDGGEVAVVALHAQLRHESGAQGLDEWLDRIVSTLALRVAAAED